ncbi:hypothetical protein [Phenylobacterium sp.]|uniref:hypothetical protein n=1 Tax=Phenylobacterium sp. TaxID=1871053 RepID=UPI0025D8C105|nr:hypothetical protein [Phenylobacterium sp.]MCA6318053.1 hypothetical protein [Phenylobacterium sp.]
MMTLMDEIARALYETPETAAEFLRGRAKIVGEETLNGRVYTQIAKDYEEVAHDLGRYIELNTKLSAQVTALEAERDALTTPVKEQWSHQEVVRLEAALGRSSDWINALLDIADGLMSFAGRPLERDRESWDQEVARFVKLRDEIRKPPASAEPDNGGA